MIHDLCPITDVIYLPNIQMINKYVYQILDRRRHIQYGSFCFFPICLFLYIPILKYI